MSAWSVTSLPGGGQPGGLQGRAAELAELTAFCAGDREYLWWKAGPWAGKSALLSTFVLNPPPGVEVVSFFITARLVAQCDSNAFTEALLDQLSAIVGETVPGSLPPAARDTLRRVLLTAAINKVLAEGRRLVLVVDGLDEDRGHQPGSGLPSVASLLPKVCGDGLRIVVASRPDPELPDDVPADHPLRHHGQIRQLAASRYATEVATRAGRELQDLLHGDRLHQDIIGLITASGGGLTLTELEELTDEPPYRLKRLLGGVFGRTITDRTDHTNTDPSRLYLFAHETLRETAALNLGVYLDVYRDRLHTWADSYRLPTHDRPAWPQDTPQYLLRGYPRMLASITDTDRLVSLAIDPIRHDRMLSVSGGDAAALAEIRACQYLLLQRPEPDLYALTRLSHHRSQLETRNANIPIDLPAVWAALNQPIRAEALVRGITDPWTQMRALTAVAEAAATAGDLDRAEQIAHTITNP
ncbi:MAG: hypothetical protein JXA67_22065, partial [Micromonosporaceae bacterium]|nr:hypothetical protein [Micromonosporaceae bacterium]